MIRIESLLSARLFLVPQLVDHRLYFISNLSGRMSLYAMDEGGSVPEPLLPPHIALQNPELMNGKSFQVYPELVQIMVMIDDNGDENYQPMLIPLSGGFPEPAFANAFAPYKTNLVEAFPEDNVAIFWAEWRDKPLSVSFWANLATGEIVQLMESTYGGFPVGMTDDYGQAIVMEAYGAGDHVAYLWQKGVEERELLYGVPLADRQPGQHVPANSFSNAYFVQDNQALLFYNSIFDDKYGLGLLTFADPAHPRPVAITGQAHEGVGELSDFAHLAGNRYLIGYNIDGCSWLYEGVFDADALMMTLDKVVVGQPPLHGGVLKGYHYDKGSDRYVVSYTTAVSPPQLVVIAGADRDQLAYQTRERVLGIPADWLSPGEDASFTSFDGLRVSARLYMPASSLNYHGPRPLVYYIHGGPQSQEHPDFAWFSMPLIQFLTLRGFAVFVPNVRGSTGYGFAYMNRVVRDWGGQDRLDHVHAMTEVLPQDARLDVSRAGVVGRSYGGFMTLTQAGRHPELWSAAVDMFGPYNLLTFADRVPESWKPYIAMLVGDPVTEPDFMRERSPSTYIHQIQCPLLVIQGKNDPRVWEQESRELVEELRGMGKEVDYLMFADEGHDVLKFDNRVRCYNAIVDFFAAHLRP